jgi:cleavage stimulation factor subunit 3
MDDLSPAHMQACTVLRQLVNHIGAIYPPNLSQIYLPNEKGISNGKKAILWRFKKKTAQYSLHVSKVHTEKLSS